MNYFITRLPMLPAYSRYIIRYAIIIDYYLRYYSGHAMLITPAGLRHMLFAMLPLTIKDITSLRHYMSYYTYAYLRLILMLFAAVAFRYAYAA